MPPSGDSHFSIRITVRSAAVPAMA
jgi:hypothetical protein